MSRLFVADMLDVSRSQNGLPVMHISPYHRPVHLPAHRAPLQAQAAYGRIRGGQKSKPQILSIFAKY